ncbi:hypothetical protein BDU57DRAFT_548615 [Ampelomyces quisqualis]|uniref:Major facilitator superfamily domain-containing protein n=1 Tax=Ampelomyces quisqualis TaxID=50730 RepID=A0A6A5QNT1_AMPQU|nr:hypothetical protein BDU57DRAFT_548615 [Ampelomyces quisqualis]
MSQCLGAPPYTSSGFLMYGAAWFSDEYKTREPVLCFLCLVSFADLPIMGFAKSPWAQHLGVFITVSGMNNAIPPVMAYQANNIGGQWRRVFCSAFSTGIGGTGGVAGALIFRTEDAPSENAKADRGKKILLEDPNFRFTI